MATSSPPGSRDRLSQLPDFLLGHVISYLPNKEAGRAAALSRRWRDVFCNVHTVSFGEHEGARASDWTTFYYDAEEKKSCSWALLNDVWSALLCRRRCAGTHVPLRRLSFAFDSCHPWNYVHVDQWLTYVLRHNSLQEIHLDLRFWLGPICPRSKGRYGDDGSDKEEEVDSDTDNSDAEHGRRKWRPCSYLLPKGLFSCIGIRTLCLSNCRMKLPKTVDLPYLETLSITQPRRDGGRSVQRLISSCPCLIDLTLEAIARLKSVTVLDKRLRRFALRCCHNVRSVDIDASELKSLDYSGLAPLESLLSLHGSPGIPSCTINLCKAPSNEDDHDRFIRFMEKISDAKRLHLHHRCLPTMSFGGFPSFSNLTRLALQGPLQSPSVVRVILEQTPNLEILSLFMEPAVVPSDNAEPSVVPGGNAAPDESSFSIPCLRSHVKEINMVHYEGDALQRTMARLLFRNALLLERMCVVLVRGTFALQDALTREIKSWVVAAHAEQIFL
ncbi:F-box/LRR-repeat protein At4g14103-like [Lolium perenne]|uniref:F-box/LRR-repeat protein At4g14103-like n=1 Tax=Lolium perenne TaxID=4522 RepID=UPI0021F6221F|nr:F-box/LRR-repeat protein At4g14103-like [Lolium perenne]